ncbi:MAG: EamA family transporter [Desulfobacterales bacterium]|nr:EamA family transporter [Desulfobacterales bacterium]
MNPHSPYDRRQASRAVQLLGSLSVFASAFCFYLATAVIRWAQAETVIDPAYFVFARFLVGFFVICAVLAVQRKGPRLRRLDLLVGRTVFNCLAVYCFFQAVAQTSLAEGNILNMTYPVFLAIFSWILLRDQRDPLAAAMVVVAFFGIWLILSPGRVSLQIESLWGLASGISAAVAIIYLNMARMYHDSETILFYMFGLGTVIIYAMFFREIFVPNAQELYYLALCAVLGVGGQYLLTLGFRFVTAVEGGVISSTRILLAALLGPVVAADPALSLGGWMGALLIFTANVVLVARK